MQNHIIMYDIEGPYAEHICNLQAQITNKNFFGKFKKIKEVFVEIVGDLTLSPLLSTNKMGSGVQPSLRDCFN